MAALFIILSIAYADGYNILSPAVQRAGDMNKDLC